jgi:hypothetical protein
LRAQGQGFGADKGAGHHHVLGQSAHFGYLRGIGQHVFRAGLGPLERQETIGRRSLSLAAAPGRSGREAARWIQGRAGAGFQQPPARNSAG